ncbi:MAG: hypothetical protein IPM35_33560 [Myxococcales bacterium]|nr:hypothetical protein [Myxococcales bacterium]
MRAPPLFAYCTERLGYSEDSATRVRVRVARLVQQFPRCFRLFRQRRAHLTGLFLFSGA